MHGNNGSIDDDPAAAMRYTEVRLAKVTQIMEDDLDKDTVEMAPNFDDTENEPTVLPVPFPVMLVNGATGIAAGYATNMPPHNLNEVVDATIFRLQNPDSSLQDIMSILPGPDFPTGSTRKTYKECVFIEQEKDPKIFEELQTEQLHRNMETRIV